MKVYGSICVPQKIEFVSYSPENHDEVLELIRNAFYRYETVSVATGIYGNVEAEKEMLQFCSQFLKKPSVSIVARDVEEDKLIGVAFNMVQTKPTSDTLDDFEIFRSVCKTENARCLTEYVISAESKVDRFELFNVDAILDVMYLAVLQEYGGKGIGRNLVKFTIELATALKNSEGSDEPRPGLVTALWTSRATQVIGKKLGFEVLLDEPFSIYSFLGENFAERVGDLSLTNQITAKRI